MWQIAALCAYFLLGIVGVIDKILISGPMRSPAAITFYSSILALLVFVLVPFVGIAWPGGFQFFLACLAGFVFACALLLYFRVIKEQEISRVIPGIAGFVPIFTLLFSVFIFHESFVLRQLFAFILLVIGGVFITFEEHTKQLKNIRHLVSVMFVAFVFSISFILIKVVYIHQPFWSGFMWMRIGGAFFALLLLFHKGARTHIFTQTSTVPVFGKTLFLSNQVIASGAFILQNFAFALGPVALVNALESTRHFFVLFFVTMLSRFYPQLVRERADNIIVLHKVVAIACIMIGLFLVFR